jgi:hypothetical protein
MTRYCSRCRGPLLLVSCPRGCPWITIPHEHQECRVCLYVLAVVIDKPLDIWGNEA